MYTVLVTNDRNDDRLFSLQWNTKDNYLNSLIGWVIAD